jgi:hypothetical protein
MENTSSVLDPGPSLAARREFRNLEEWLFSEESLCRPIHEIELEQEQKMREVNRLLLQGHVRSRGPGDQGRIIKVETADDQTETFLRGKIRACHPTTIFGPIEVERFAYSKPKHHSVWPLEEALQLPHRTYSYELQRRLTKEAVKGSFLEGCSSVEGSTGVKVPKRSAELITAEAAQDFDAFYKQVEVPPPGETGPILVAQVDCKGIPMKKNTSITTPKAVPLKKGKKANKKRMATVATAFTAKPRIRTAEEVVESLFSRADEKAKKKKDPQNRPEHKRVWASLKKGKDAVIQELRDDVERRDPEATKLRVGLTDGEKALQIRMVKYIPGLLLILDIMHALGYLWKAAYSFHPEGSTEAIKWVRDRVLRILQGRTKYVIRGMRQSATKRNLSEDEREAVEKAANYFKKNLEYMRYDEYLAAGLPIASGPIEGACRNLVKDRMECSGMRWTENGAEAMVQMRALHLNGDFDAYWKFHIEQDQKKLKKKRGSPLPLSA